MIRIKLIQALSEIDEHSWNGLIDDNNPFCLYAFLNCLEKHKCVGEEFGWLPRHLLAYDNQTLIGALILYEKHNDYGEFVFDYAWAQAYARYHVPYYPKLVSTIPYTPAVCNKLLTNHPDKHKIYTLLLNAAQKLCQDLNTSGVHILFNPDEQQRFLNKQPLLFRQDCQFHWHNQNYHHFDDFLAQLSSKKRKNIRRERRLINTQDITIRVLDGHSASHKDWADFTVFYQHTFLTRLSPPVFNFDFFSALAEQMPEQIVMVLAQQDGKSIAGALMFRDDTTLYGRHWGCIKAVDFLHFELCYYQGIDYCIKHKLKYFQPGAQGEYKFTRGFSAVTTHSAHFLKDDFLKTAIGNFCDNEKMGVEGYINTLNQHNPYKKQVKN